MNLKSEELTHLGKIAILAAKKAGELISSYVDKNVSVQNKEGGDSLASQVVTEVDIKAQEIILNILAQSISDYDLALLTEESEDDKSRLEKDFFWCIDPMDGTLAFTKKMHGYAVSIGLVSKAGEPHIGVVYDPVTKTLYHAIKNQGAYLNEHPWRPDLSCQNTTDFLLNMDCGFIDNPIHNILKTKIENFLPELGLSTLKIRKQAGAVLNACWVVENAPGCYFKLAKPEPGGGSFWDFAATSCIIQEAGAFVSDIYGNVLELNQAGSTFMNHKGVLFASNKEIQTKIIELNRMLSDLENPSI